MIKILKSEFYKIKHTWIPSAHFIIPIAYAILFYGAYRTTGLKNFEDTDIIQNYFALLGAVIPIVASLIISKEVDMEISAGNFQVLLFETKSRGKAYIGKLISLLIGLLFSTTLATILFGLLFRREYIGIFFLGGLLIFIGSLSIYIMHLWMTIIVGGGASIGLGFMETLIALLSLTRLGDNIWYFIPCTWPSRLSATFIVGSFTYNSFIYDELTKWAYIGITCIVVIFIGSLIWFSKWDVKSFAY